jgi:hypothetical protein
MTTVGDVLDEFFSPLSAEKLWTMPESDNYTEIVRKWQVVIDATNRVKSSISTSCALWSANFKTNPTWKPTKTDTPKAHALERPMPEHLSGGPLPFPALVMEKAVKKATFKLE